MALLGEYRDQDVLLDHGMVVLRDSWPDDAAGDAEPAAEEPGPGALDDDLDDVLGEFHSGLLAGTLVTAGYGWLRGDARDEGQDVLLELHDAPPPLDLTGWPDVAETPYGSTTGLVGVDFLVGGSPDVALDLGSGPGLYRVRVHRRDLTEEERRQRAETHVPGPDDLVDEEFEYVPPATAWRLQFWADPSPTLPRRLVRLPVDPGPRTDLGWSRLLGWAVDALLSDVAAAAGVVHGDRSQPVTITDLTLRRQTYEPAGLDAALWPPAPTPLPTGHRDLDDEARAEQARADDETRAEREQLGVVAAQVGLPTPGTGREALDLLAALGLLTRSTLDGRPAFAHVDPPPPVQSVLRLEADELERISYDEDDHRWGDLAQDVAAVAMWHTVVGGEALSLRSLAALLLLPEADVRAALRQAGRGALLRVDGDPDDPHAPLDLALLPDAPFEDEPQYLPTAAYEEDGGPPVPWEQGDPPPAGVFGTGPGPVSEDEGPLVAGTWTWLLEGSDITPMPSGAGPLAGYVADEQQLVLPGGAVRVDLEVTPTGLWETRAGVLVTHDDGVVLVRRGGAVEQVEGSGPVAVAEDGRLVALHAGSAPSWRRRTIQLVDPATGERTTLEHPPWDDAAEVEVVAVHGGAVHLMVSDPHDGPRTHWTWRPGSPPEAAGAAVDAVDPWSGTTLTRRDGGGVTVTVPDGPATQVLLGLEPRLVPGGRGVWTVRHDPPAVSLFDVHLGAPVEPARVCWLPGTAVTLPDELVWEDEHHLLVPVEHPLPDLCVVRVDVRDGLLEAAVREEYTYREVRLVTPYAVRD